MSWPLLQYECFSEFHIMLCVVVVMVVVVIIMIMSRSLSTKPLKGDKFGSTEGKVFPLQAQCGPEGE